MGVSSPDHIPELRFVSIKHLQLVPPPPQPHITHQACLLLVPSECTTESPSQKPGNHPNYLFVPHPCTYVISQSDPANTSSAMSFESPPSSSAPQSQTWVPPFCFLLVLLKQPWPISSKPLTLPSNHSTRSSRSYLSKAQS